MKTVQEIRREAIRELFNRVLGTQILELSPILIATTDSVDRDFTTVSLSYNEEVAHQTTHHRLKGVKARGFVDGVFMTLLEKYSERYNSLGNIQLAGLTINPNFKKKTNSLGTDAITSVVFQVKVKDHGLAEFESTSRSLLLSGFSASLKAFQFYINCQRTFEHVKIAIANAQERNRGDIVQKCLLDLHCLTTVNSYEK